MHLIFERSKGRFKSNCNILALAWMPYYNEVKFRKALFEYHQRQLINLSCSIAANNPIGVSPSRSRNLPPSRRQNSGYQANNEVAAASLSSRPPPPPPQQPPSQSGGQDESTNNVARNCDYTQEQKYLNSRIAELHHRHLCLVDSKFNSTSMMASNDVTSELDLKYGKMPDFGWLVVGNVGKIVGITLTSIVSPPKDLPVIMSSQLELAGDNKVNERDLIVFQEIETSQDGKNEHEQQDPCSNLARQSEQLSSSQLFEQERPDKRCLRNNHNLRGHLDEVILVKWNELYQKLATVDSKGNVLIWCKINEKFTIQTPFYNRTKSVADFKWSNDGKTALICYTDSFILVGSSSGQRHWHSMLNLDDYHITCASWTPNDEQLLLGVSNGNVVVIDLPRSELTELAVNQTNVRNMCWSTSEINLKNTIKLSNSSLSSSSSSSQSSSGADSRPPPPQIDSKRTINRRSSTIVNHRRLSRDCSVFSRYRFCSQAPTYGNNNALNSSSNNQSQNNSSRARSGIQQELQQNSNFQGCVNQQDVFNNRDMNDLFCKEQSNILAIDFANNTIKLFDGGLDDSEPKTIEVNQESYLMQWSSDGKVLAVAGFNIHTTAPSVGCLRCRYLNAIIFFNQKGQLIYEYTMRYTRYPITAFTWAHDDKRIFIATGPKLHCAKIFSGIPRLNLLTMSCFQRNTRLPDKGDIMESILNRRFSTNIDNWRSHNCPINLKTKTKRRQQEATNKLITTLDGKESSESLIKIDSCNNCNVFRYKLPFELQVKIDELFAQTIKQPFDDNWSLNDIIWHVPKFDQRYHCTLVCYTSDGEINTTGYQYQTSVIDRVSDNNYTSDQNKIFVLYVEFEGSLIPILRARRVGFLKPEFVIFDPEDNQFKNQRQRKVSDIYQQSYLNNYIQKKFDQHNNLMDSQQSNIPIAANSIMSNSSPFYYNDGFTDNCSDLHLYSDARASGGSMGRQSLASDAEHYYNFECDTTNKQNSNRMVDLTNDRSHHQEPVAMPMSNNPYLMYMLSMSTGHQQLQNRQQLGPTNTAIPSKHYKDHYKLGNPGLRSSLTETKELIRVKSNIWGTKFKLLNSGNRMIKQRTILGSVVYTASILHLQPREISLKIRDMSNYCCLCSTHHHSCETFTNRSSCSSKRNNSHVNKEVSLIDLPNLEPPLITPQFTNTDTKKNKKRDKHTAKGEPRGKVVLDVGDRIRITPKLEANQEYRLKGSYIVDNQRPTTSRASSARPCRRDRSEVENSREYSITARSFSKANINHLRPSKNSTMSTSKKSTNVQEISSTNHNNFDDETSDSAMDNEDDILTLSLDQGDQVRVDMSSMRSLDNEIVVDERDTKQSTAMSEFLATNKTLKSIQTITKMIVDLSSKVGDLSDEENGSKLEIDDKLDAESKDFSSPSKLVKLSDDASKHPSPFRYIAPDPPVHRPRRIASKLSSDKLQTQSASTTPLRSVDGELLMSGRRVKRGQANRVKEEPVFNPLPPEPKAEPYIPIGKRLSSSAKRFIDGSLRSLYSSGYSITTSDSEAEDGEPLVSSRVRSTFSGAISGGGFRKGVRERFFGGQSQPCTPVKSLPRQPSDLLPFREQLVNKLRSKSPSPSTTTKASKEHKYPYKEARKCLMALKFDSSGYLDENSTKIFLDYLAKNNIGRSRNSTPPTSDEDLSASVSSLEDSSADIDRKLTEVGLDIFNSSKHSKEKRVKTAHKFSAGSNSVKDLRDVGLKRNTEQVVGGKITEGHLRNRHQHRHRKHNRKSICLNANCCCAKEFKLNNRPPVWNDVNQIYQLDFGGRVTQESAKNLQIDFEGNLVSNYAGLHSLLAQSGW